MSKVSIARIAKSVVPLNESQSAWLDKIVDAFASGELRLERSTCVCITGSPFYRTDLMIARADAYGLSIPTVLCVRCGLVRSRYIQTADSMMLFYSKYYAPHMFTCASASDSLGMSVEQYLEEEIGRGSRALEVMNLAQIDKSGITTVLDIGCGAGGALSVFHQLGYRCIGIDFSAGNIENGRKYFQGIRFELGGINVLGGLKADLVLCNDVLEHVVNPIDFFRDLAGVLKAGSILYLNSPGLFGISEWRFEGRLRRFLRLEHTWCFNRRSVEQILTSQGFEVRYASESVEVIAVYIGHKKPTSSHGYRRNISNAVLTIVFITSIPFRRFFKLDKLIFGARRTLMSFIKELKL